MSIEVACPACGTKLKAPDDAAGKRVKCKKCEHRFVIPGEIVAEPVGESQFLSEMDFTTPAVVPPREQPTPAPAPTSGDPFSFDEGDGSVVRVGSSLGKKPTKDKSDSSYKTKRSGKNEPKKGSGKTILFIVLGVFGALGLTCAGITAAVYFLLIAPTVDKVKQLQTAPTKAATTVVPEASKEVAPTPAATEQAVPKTAPKNSKMPAKTPEVKTPEKMATPAPMMKTAGKLIAPKKATVKLDMPLESLRDVKFGGKRGENIAVVWVSDAGFQGEGAKETVSVYSATNGFLAGSMEYPAASRSSSYGRPLALSADGKFVAFADVFSKVTLFDVTAKKAILEGKEPYEGEPWANTGITNFVFTDDGQHLIMLNLDGFGNAWKLSDGTRLPSKTSRKIVIYDDSRKYPIVVAKPGSKLSTILSPAGIVETLNVPGVVGETNTKLKPLPPEWAQIEPEFCVSDARNVLFAGFGNGKIAFYNKINNKVRTIDLPECARGNDGRSFLAGDQLLAVANSFDPGLTVIDVETSKINYTISKQKDNISIQCVFMDEATSLLWYPLTDPADEKKTILVAVPADFDSRQALLAESTTGAVVSLTPTLDGLIR